MAVCIRINGKKRFLCTNDLDKVIKLKDRELTEPLDFGDVDVTEEFDEEDDGTWALCETPRGASVFDGTNVERNVTHRWYIRFQDDITAETWIEFEDKLYDILLVTDLEERHEWMQLDSSVRGKASNEANQA